MTADRTIRLLTALQTSGSTSRVLNLLAVERAHVDEPGYLAAPLFRDPVLNRSVIVKHRLRLDELYMFDSGRSVVTKLILPFDKADLKLGGRAILVGQKGWKKALRADRRACDGLDRDIELLEQIDRLPSLDPFLLREQLRRHGHEPARCYFAITEGDLARMHRYVADQIERLVLQATQHHHGPEQRRAAERMVEAMLSETADERLAPLREALGLDGEAFSEGVFSWRGFLYYKWSLNHLWPQLDEVMDGLGRLVVAGGSTPGGLEYIGQARARLQRAIVDYRLAVSRGLGVYDFAFNELSRNGEPDAFVAFLRRAPGLFLDLGEKVGALAHMAGYWRYRFPDSRPARAQIEELTDILQDFEAGLVSLPLAA
jgi:hypothetical protein